MYQNQIVGLPSAYSKNFYIPLQNAPVWPVQATICVHLFYICGYYVHEFATPDLAPCLWPTGSYDCPNVVVASVYCDNTILHVSPQLEQVVTHCDLNSYPLELAMDSNAHSLLWGNLIIIPGVSFFKSFLLNMTSVYIILVMSRLLLL
jgi:hypothetical protein